MQTEIENMSSDRVLQSLFEGWMMAIIMALLSGFAGVYTEAIMKKRPLRNINVQNFWLYVFGMIFNVVAIVIQDFDAVIMNKIHLKMMSQILMILCASPDPTEMHRTILRWQFLSR